MAPNLKITPVQNGGLLTVRLFTSILIDEDGQIITSIKCTLHNYIN
jgi:hypothetical protein